MAWKVKVSRLLVLDKVKENRKEHNSIFQEALEGYRTALLAHFNKQIDTLKEGKTPEVYVRLPVPEDHTRDYDYVIGMLEDCVDDSVELGVEEYSHYVKDDWDWKSRFLETSSAYLSH